jgi:hypothetical protein
LKILHKKTEDTKFSSVLLQTVSSPVQKWFSALNPDLPFVSAPAQKSCPCLAYRYSTPTQSPRYYSSIPGRLRSRISSLLLLLLLFICFTTVVHYSDVEASNRSETLALPHIQTKARLEDSALICLLVHPLHILANPHIHNRRFGLMIKGTGRSDSLERVRGKDQYPGHRQ